MHGAGLSSRSRKRPILAHPALFTASSRPPHLLPEELLSRIRVVLSHTSHPGNTGSTARAMKTMGLSRLVLVNPKRFPDPEAVALSSNAEDVLVAAQVVSSMGEALAGTVLSVAAVGHTYDLSQRFVTCRTAASEIVETAAAGDVAIVFGTESTGLSADEVRLCNFAAHIPGNPAYTSLNLAAAVQIFAYEARLAAVGDRVRDPATPDLATHDDIERLHEHAARVLANAGFYDPANPKRLLPRLRRMVAKARLEREEVQILRGMLKLAEDGPHPGTVAGRNTPGTSRGNG